MIWFEVKNFLSFLWNGKDWNADNQVQYVVTYDGEIVHTGRCDPLLAAIRIPILKGRTRNVVAIGYASGSRFGVLQFKVARTEEERVTGHERFRKERM